MEKAGEPNTVMCPRIRVKNRDFRSLRDKTRSCECVCPGARSVDRAAFGRSMSCLVVWGFCRVEGGAWLRPARSFLWMPVCIHVPCWRAMLATASPVLSCGCLSASSDFGGIEGGGAGYGRPALFPVGASVPTARPLKAG